MRPSIALRPALAGFGIGLGSLALLGALIGWVGASRAYAVGLHTVLIDHLPAVILVCVVAATFAFVATRRLTRSKDAWALVVAVAVADVVVAVLITLAVDEMRRAPDIARAIAAETVGGSLFAAATIGALFGWFARRTIAGVDGIER